MLGKLKKAVRSYIKNIVKQETSTKQPATKKVQNKIIRDFGRDVSSMELKKEKALKMLNLSFQKSAKDFTVNLGNKQIAMDSYADSAKPAINFDGTAKDIAYTFFSKFGFIGWQLCGMLSQHWLISNACSIPAKDAIRNGWQNTFADEDNNIKEGSEQKNKEQKFLNELNEITNTKYKLSAKAIQWITKYNIYGIGLALPIVEGIDLEKPFNIDGVKKGSFKGISIIDPYWLTPEFDMEVMSDPTKPDFYEPTWYRTANGQKIHKTHFIIIRRKEVPDILKPSYYFGGIPLTQEIYERVYASEKSANEQPLLLLTKRLNTWKIDLNEFFLDPEKYTERINNFTEKRDNQGVLLIDHEDELGQTDTSLSDLDQVVMSQYKLVSAVARIPVDKLFELNPSGSLSNNGDYNIKNYNQDLNTMQNDLFKPLIDRVNELTMRSYYDRKDRISIVFNPTDNPTANELAESVKTEVETLQSLIGSNVITTDEARQKLISNKTNGFSFLDEEAPEQEDNSDIDQMLAQAKGGQNNAQKQIPQANTPKAQQQAKKQPLPQAQSKDSAVIDTDWITVHPKGHKKGQHVPIEEGQNKGQGIKEHFARVKDPEYNMYASENNDDNDDSFDPTEFDPEYKEQQEKEQQAYEDYMDKQQEELKKQKTLPAHKQELSDMGISRIQKPTPEDSRWKEYNDLSPRIKRYFFTDREGALKWDEAQDLLQKHKGNDTEDIFEYLRVIDIQTPHSRTNERTRNYLKGTSEDSNWKEEEHPRDEKGQFAKKDSSGTEEKEEIKTLKNIYKKTLNDRDFYASGKDRENLDFINEFLLHNGYEMKTYIPPEEYGDIDFMQLELVKTDKQPRKEYTQVVKTKNNFDLKLVPYTEEQYQKRKKWVEGIVAKLGIDVENVKKQLNSQKDEKEESNKLKVELKKLAKEKLKDTKATIHITGNEFEGKTIEEKRENAKIYFEREFKNHKFPNKSLGKEIKVLGGNKTFNNTANINKINSFKYLDKMLTEATYLTSKPENKGRTNIKQWHYLGNKINNDDIVIITVREDNNGDIYYNHSLEDENKKEVEPTTDSLLKCEGFSSTSDNTITYKNKNVKCYFLGTDEE